MEQKNINMEAAQNVFSLKQRNFHTLITNLRVATGS